MEWPAEGKTAYFDDLVQPILKAIRFAYRTTRKNENKDIKWTGLPLTLTSILAGCPQIEDHLTAESLDYDKNDQGRSALEVLVGCAVQLGIEQGTRMERERNRTALMLLRSVSSLLEDK